MEFGDILKQIRKERGLSQDELAALLGTTKQVLSRYETKKRVPRLSVVSDYAQKLGIPLSMLSGEAADPVPEITRENGVRRVPILGGAACGEPIYKPGDDTEYIDVDGDLPCDFALIAQGDSMTGDRICDGDVVFFRAQDDVDDGQIAAVELDGGMTIKRIKRLRAPSGAVVYTQLLSSNQKYDSIDIGGPGETRTARIRGKAVAFKAKLNV